MIENLLHDYWNSQSVLRKLLAPEQVLTGPLVTSTLANQPNQPMLPKLPCLIITVENGKTIFRTNKERPWERTGLTLELRHESLDAALELMRQVTVQLDRKNLSLPSGDGKARIDFTAVLKNRYENGVWIVTRHIDVTTWGSA